MNPLMKCSFRFFEVLRWRSHPPLLSMNQTNVSFSAPITPLNIHLCGAVCVSLCLVYPSKMEACITHLSIPTPAQCLVHRALDKHLLNERIHQGMSKLDFFFCPVETTGWENTFDEMRSSLHVQLICAYHQCSTRAVWVWLTGVTWKGYSEQSTESYSTPK